MSDFAQTSADGVRAGDTVWHETHGFGEVIEEWGMFWACSHCCKTLESGSSKCCPGGHANAVSGHGVFDVRFGGRIRSINKWWLRKVEVAVG